MEEFNPNEKSKGLGDTIAKITHATGIDKVVDKIADTLGIEDCGCNARRQILNRVIPYQSPRSSSNFEINEVPVEIKEGIYLVNQNIYITKDNEKYSYKIGDRILINKQHPIFNDLKIYIMVGSLILE